MFFTLLLNETLKFIIISVLVVTFITFIILTFYLIKLIKIRTNLKAKIFSEFNQYCEKGNILFVGDSLTEFYNIDEFFHTLNPYNRGIASDTTDGVIARLDDNVISIEPRKVFLQIGTNDLGNRKTRDINRVFANIKFILERIHEKLPDSKLYMISLYPVNPKAKFFSHLSTGLRKNAIICNLNLMLENYCKETNIPFINCYNALTDDLGNLKKEYTIEGLHISFKGYQKITEILYPYLAE